MARRRSEWWGIAAAVIATLAVGIYGFNAFRGAPAGFTVGGPFTLADSDGKTVRDSDFRGRWMLVYFGYTHCPDACPTALNTMALALDQVGAVRPRIQPIFITIDPERDTQSALKSYTAAFAPDLIGLTGSPDAIKAVEREYHVYAQKHAEADGEYEMDHSSVIYVMDPSGRLAATFTHENTPDEIGAKLKSLVS